MSKNWEGSNEKSLVQFTYTLSFVQWVGPALCVRTPTPEKPIDFVIHDLNVNIMYTNQLLAVQHLMIIRGLASLAIAFSETFDPL